jgi:hypothetical protein
MWGRTRVTTYFHIRWKTTWVSGFYGNILRGTASQLQRFLGFNKGLGNLLRMRHEAVLQAYLFRLPVAVGPNIRVWMPSPYVHLVFRLVSILQKKLSLMLQRKSY